MATQSDEAENAEKARNVGFRVVRRRGHKRKTARQWLYYGRSSQDLARFRNERESGLTNASLHDFAKRVKGPPHLEFGIATGVAGIAALLFWLIFAPSDYPRYIWLPLIVSSLSFASEQYKNFVGAKAAALLAERGDDRALAPLTRLWNAWGETPFLTETGWRHFDKWLAEGYVSPPPASYKELRVMVKRAFPFRRRFQYADFSDAATDTLLAALRCLAPRPYDENKAVLRHVARFPLPPNAPNRALLREMATLFLDDPKPVVPLQRPVNPAILPTPSILPTAIAPSVSPEITEQTAALNRRI